MFCRGISLRNTKSCTRPSAASTARVVSGGDRSSDSRHPEPCGAGGGAGTHLSAGPGEGRLRSGPGAEGPWHMWAEARTGPPAFWPGKVLLPRRGAREGGRRRGTPSAPSISRGGRWRSSALWSCALPRLPPAGSAVPHRSDPMLRQYSFISEASSGS